MKNPILSLFSAVLMACVPAFAADGDLDTAYSTPAGFNTVSFGGSDNVYGGILQPDGKFIVIGGGRPVSNQEMSAARFNADGTLDTSFAASGKFSLDLNPATTTDRGTCGGLQSDGKIIIGGYTRVGPGNDDYAVVRLNTNGSLDSTFGTSGIAKVDFNGGTDRAQALAVLPDNSIVLTGLSADFNASPDFDFSLAKLTPGGALDTSFGSGGKITVDVGDQQDNGNGIAVQSDGRIVFCGQALGSGTTSAVVGRLTAAGALDTTFGGGDGLYTATNSTPYDFRDVEVQPDGKIVAVGNANVSNQLDGLMLRLTSTGVLDTSFNSSGMRTFPFGTLSDLFVSVLVQADGKYVAGGFWQNPTPNLLETVLVRVTSAGALDSGFGTGGIKQIAIGSGSNRPGMVGQASNGKLLVAIEGGLPNAENFIAARFHNTVASVATAPTVTTSTQSNITATSATLSGNVTADGGASVTERGIVWGTSTGPTTAGNKVQNGSGIGTFSGTVTGLPSNSTIFVRAYAINSVNTSYGSEISFLTLPPTASISVSPASVSEDGATNLTCTVTLSSAVPASTTVNITTTGTAGSLTDYTGGVTTLTIPANTTTGTITIDPTVDGTIEADETVILTVAPGTGYTVGAPSSATGTILNDDVPSVTMAVSPANVVEDGAGNLTYTVTLNQASLSNISVAYTIGGTATNGTDCATISSPLVITAGNTTGTITVNPTADATIEANETVILTLAAGTGYNVGVPNSATGTILNDDLPNLAINDVTANEGNSGTTTFTFTVSLSAPAGPGGVTFDITTANGSASQPDDYTLNSLTGQTIPAGSSTYTFTVQVTGNTLNEPTETFFVNVTNVVNAVLVDGQGVGTVVNDDPLPSLSVSDVSVAEGDAGTATLTFTAALSAASGQTVTVNYATADGTASAPADYTATSGMLTFQSGQTTRTFNVSVNGDTTVETDETFFANLSGATNATISDNQGVGTITNDDAAADIPVSLSGGDLNVDASGSAGAANVVLRYATGPGGPFLEIFDAGRTLGAPSGGVQVDANTVRIPLASLTSITLTGSAQADTFVLNFSDGDICPSGGISVLGGGPTVSPGDELIVDGDFNSGGSYGPTGVGAGTLTLDSGNTVTFTGLEPVDMSLASFTTFTVNVDPTSTVAGNVTTTVAAVDAGVNTEITFSGGLESVKLGAVTTALIINGDTVDNDYFMLQGLGSAMVGDFSVDGMGGNADVVDIHDTTITVAGLGKNFLARADFVGIGRQGTLQVGNIVCSGNITLEADGDNTITPVLWGTSGVYGTSRPAYFGHTALSGERGSVAMGGTISKASGPDATCTLKARAVVSTPLLGTIISTSSKLNVVLHADTDALNGGAVSVSQQNVIRSNGGDITIGGGANPATSPAIGASANGANLNFGVTINGSEITSGGGNISIRGTGRAANNNVGVNIQAQQLGAGTVIDSGTGTLTVVGTNGGNFTGSFGVRITGAANASAIVPPAAFFSTRLISSTGAIHVEGVSTGGNTNGVSMLNWSEVLGSGASSITITGVGTGSGVGINLAPAASVSTVDGPMTATASVSSAGGGITLIADKMALNAGTGNESITTSGAGGVTLKPLTPALAVAVGSAVDSTAGTLELGNTELDTITGDILTIGEAASGAINVSAVIAPLGFKTLALARDSTFSATSGFTSDVTAVGNYEKITVLGTVSIAPGSAFTANAAGGYVWNGTDSFTFLDNDGTDAITGTFTGPTLSSFLGSALTAAHRYNGGTGNDFVVGNAPPTFSGYAFTLNKGENGRVYLAKILARAADSDGGTLSITGVSGLSAQGHAVTLLADAVQYAPASGFTGMDTFTVTISDGQGNNVTGTITVTVADPGESKNRASLAVMPSGDVALVFMAVPGQSYHIQRSTDLVNWTTLQTVSAAADGSLSFTDTAPPPGAAFYRTAQN